MLQRHFQAHVEASQQGAREAAAAHAAVVTAALGTLSAFVDWAPMGRISSGQVRHHAHAGCASAAAAAACSAP
jgi:hypothetical protein